jgi:hypothetical protein
MPLTNIKLPKKTNTQTNAFTGASGEVTIDTDKKIIVVHDGSTAGGLPLARESYTNSAFVAANTADQKGVSAGSYANGAFDAANASINFIGLGTANSASSYANGAFVVANTATAAAAAAFATANASVNFIALGTANSASSYANASFAAANTKYASTGGTISGDVVITGNLTISGNTTYANTTTVNLGDNIITLNADLPASLQPSEDAGIAIDRGVQPNSQFLWVESAGKWSANNGNTSFYIGSESDGLYANAAFDAANASVNFIALGTANSASSYANGAFVQANTAATAYITPRVVVITDGTTVTMNANTTDIATQSNSQTAGTLTIAAPTGTPSNGQKLILRLLSVNIQTFSWNATFQGSTDLALPTASSGSNKYDYMGFIWNSTNSKWQLLAKNMGY